MSKFSLLILLIGIVFTGQSQLITTTSKKVSKLSFDTTTQVFVNINIVSSYRELEPNTAHLNTPLGARSDETPLTLSSYTLGISIPLTKCLKINSGLSLLQNGEAYNWYSNIDDSSYTYTSVFRYISMPITLSAAYGKNLKVHFGLGIIPGIFSSYKKSEAWTDEDGTNSSEETTIQDDLNSFSIAAQATMGLEYFFKSFSIRASYIYRRQLNNTYYKYEDYVHRSIASGGQIAFTYFL